MLQLPSRGSGHVRGSVENQGELTGVREDLGGAKLVSPGAKRGGIPNLKLRGTNLSRL